MEVQAAGKLNLEFPESDSLSAPANALPLRARDRQRAELRQSLELQQGTGALPLPRAFQAVATKIQRQRFQNGKRRKHAQPGFVFDVGDMQLTQVMKRHRSRPDSGRYEVHTQAAQRWKVGQPHQKRLEAAQPGRIADAVSRSVSEIGSRQ